ncbi:hypothetical protein D9M71_790600 [compost metagenome]
MIGLARVRVNRRRQHILHQAGAQLEHGHGRQGLGLGPHLSLEHRVAGILCPLGGRRGQLELAAIRVVRIRPAQRMPAEVGTLGQAEHHPEPRRVAHHRGVIHRQGIHVQIQ